MQEDIPLGLPTPCTPATHSCGQSSNSFQPQQEQTSWLRMLWSSLIFECWRAASGEYGPIPCVMTGRTQAELKVPWVLKPERGVGGRGGQSWRGLGGVVKIFTGHQEKSGGCINAFPTLSHTNHETTWNVSPTHMFPLSFTSSFFFFFNGYSPVLLSFNSHPVLISCFLIPHSHFGIFPLLNLHYDF